MRFVIVGFIVIAIGATFAVGYLGLSRVDDKSVPELPAEVEAPPAHGKPGHDHARDHN